jgi:hypothetical protein
MHNDPLIQIEAWFTEHDGDGEFRRPLRDAAYSVIWPLASTSMVLVTTRVGIAAAAIEASDDSSSFGMIGRYGLPMASDIAWFREMAVPRQLLFLGDLDPPDLMIFAWLRESLFPTPIRYLGIGDELLRSLSLTVTSNFLIPCTQSERDVTARLDNMFPDWREITGPRCAALLTNGNKIEIEAVACAGEGPAALLRPANLNAS